MEEFQEKKLIVRINKDFYQLDSIDELTKEVLGEEYKELTENEKLMKRYDSVLPFSKKDNLPIVFSPKGVIREDKTLDSKARYDIDSSILIDDELTYFLSLCRLNQLQILEERDANIFTSNMDKRQVEGNYILVNKFVDELLKGYVKGTVTEEKTLDEK